MTFEERRHSMLAPMDFVQEMELSLRMIYFFSAVHNVEMKAALRLPATPGKITPLRIADFLDHLSSVEETASRQMVRVLTLAGKLERAGFLECHGGSNYTKSFLSVFEVTTKQSQGALVLGRALGPSFLADTVQPALVHVTGKDESGDISGGTGLLFTPNAILTCAHVVTDMVIDAELRINGDLIAVRDVVAHEKEDVAIIYLQEEVILPLLDLAFRPSRLLEEVLICGYPPIPFATEPRATFHRGEIAAVGVPTFHKSHVDLFTAIARPGNSGGPVLSAEGQVVGIVTQRLESETLDGRSSAFPFFAAVPAETIKLAVEELSGGMTVVPWEYYQ